MPIESTAALVSRARALRQAAPAFNVITLEHAEAIAAGAERAGRPAILQISENAVRYHGAVAPLACACVAIAAACDVPLALHLDHVTDVELLHLAADCGFSSVMFDGGALPYAQNLHATADAVRWAHEHELWLEAELGYVGGKPDMPAGAHAAGVRTDPSEAVAFVAATGVDALAVAVGSSHAMAERRAELDLALIGRLHDVLDVPLVLHGSSGVPVAGLRAAIAAGLTKINIGTALNVAFTETLRRGLGASPDPRRYLAPARDAIADEVTRLLADLAEPTSPT